jgi:hypothetical protein
MFHILQKWGYAHNINLVLRIGVLGLYGKGEKKMDARDGCFAISLQKMGFCGKISISHGMKETPFKSRVSFQRCAGKLPARPI